MPSLDTLYARAARRLRPDDWLVHTYTRERRVSAGKDPYGEDAGFTYPLKEPGIPCYYKDTIVQGFDVSGNPVVVNQVTLTLRADDTLARGDRVSMILDRNLGVVEAGPMFVRVASTTTSFGPGLFAVAVLQRTEGQG